MPGKFTFFTQNIDGERARFPEAEFKHAIQALRFKVGDEIEFTDGLGTIFNGVIKTIGKREFDADIIRSVSVTREKILRIAMGLIKSTDRMEWMVEKCTELGVASINFVQTANSERGKLNTERMEKVAVAALKQSHGAWLPQLQVSQWQDIITRDAPNKAIAWVGAAESKPLHAMSGLAELLLLIGPEGDFTEVEIAQAMEKGFVPVSLGHSVLRTETACVASASVFLLS